MHWVRAQTASVYKLANAHFLSGSAAAFPAGVPAQRGAGVFYATTVGGGPANIGTIYSLTYRQGKAVVTVLHAFNGSDGAEPGEWLIQDDRGNLYGQTVEGGPAERANSDANDTNTTDQPDIVKGTGTDHSRNLTGWDEWNGVGTQLDKRGKQAKPPGPFSKKDALS